MELAHLFPVITQEEAQMVLRVAGALAAILFSAVVGQAQEHHRRKWM